MQGSSKRGWEERESGGAQIRLVLRAGHWVILLQPPGQHQPLPRAGRKVQRRPVTQPATITSIKLRFRKMFTTLSINTGSSLQFP